MALASAARALTPLVCIVPPDGLLLEVHGSLKLFGGLESVKKKLVAELDRRRLRHHLCAAPTPLAASWLARAAAEDVLETSALPGRLSRLPLAVTRWPEDVLAGLAEMGIRTLGECIRLPRDGFARRVGREYLEQLDKALGKRPDPRVELGASPALRSMVELPAEITQTAALTSVLRDIVARLGLELRRLQRQVLSVELVFHHSHKPATREKLQLIEPTHEARRLLGPLTTRLERLALPAPVIAFGLIAVPVEARIEEAELFDALAPGRNPAAPAALVERLRARLGIERVYGLELVEDHRPERVWARRAEELFQASAPSAPPSLGTARPLWILPSPVRLRAVSAEIDGTMPERIESGWWDGGDIGRDYYAISTGRGQRLWIYKDHATRGWYLHGLFG
ncbi:MAG TPA: DNA polymerase Y family protein [Gammaproteobacteria bacterium]|jgi:protein ImuB